MDDNKKDKITEKKETKKKINIKELIMANKKIVLGVLLALVALIIIIIIVVAVSDKDEEEPKEPGKKPSGDVIIADEGTVEEEYGFSKDDAINVIKKIFNSDNYEFSATVREDNMYLVTVKNSDNGNEYNYIVDPNDGSFMMLVEE